MAKKMLFLYNPKAGRNAIKTKLAEILNILTAGGYDILVRPSQAPMDMENIVKELSLIHI